MNRVAGACSHGGTRPRFKTAALAAALFCMTVSCFTADYGSYEPVPLREENGKRIEFYFPHILTVGFTFMKCRVEPPLLIKNSSGRQFWIIKFTQRNVDEYFTKEGILKSHSLVTYEVPERALKRMNGLIKNGVVKLWDIFDRLNLREIDPVYEGDRAAPGREGYDTRRSLRVYDIIVEDGKKERVPLQLMVENTIHAGKVEDGLW